VSSVSDALNTLGLTAESIAFRSKLSVDRVRSLLEGAPARLSDIQALSLGLRVPKSFFGPQSQSRRQNDSLRMRFRSAPQVRPGFDLTADRVADFVHAALSLLPPAPEIPGEPPHLERESYSVARTLAAKFRETYCGGDMVSALTVLPNIVAGLPGIILSLIRESRFEGISVSQGGYTFIFVSPRFSGRMLFTLAHEVGHILAGHVHSEQPLFETASSIGNFGQGKASERFVDAFASCLLLPDEGVLGFLSVTRQQLGIDLAAPLGDIELLLLARFFGVSFDVAARRCEDLELLPRGGGASIGQLIRKNYKSPEKRADELGLPSREYIEFPTVSPALRRAIISGIEGGDVSAGWVSDQFDLSLSELHDLHKQEILK
jgi:Zn-dependent peptidase ImmA (M78 family)